MNKYSSTKNKYIHNLSQNKTMGDRNTERAKAVRRRKQSYKPNKLTIGIHNDSTMNKRNDPPVKWNYFQVHYTFHQYQLKQVINARLIFEANVLYSLFVER